MLCDFRYTRVNAHGCDNSGGCAYVDRSLLTSRKTRNVGQRQASVMCDSRYAFVSEHGCDDSGGCACIDCGLRTSGKVRDFEQRLASALCDFRYTRVSAHGYNNSGGCACVDRSLLTSWKTRNASQRPASATCDFRYTQVSTHGCDDGGGCACVDRSLLTSWKTRNASQRHASVLCETGVRTRFLSLLGLRHSHNAPWGTDDVYFLAALEPLAGSDGVPSDGSGEEPLPTQLDSVEIAGVQWSEASAFASSATHPFARFADIALRARESPRGLGGGGGLDITAQKVYVPTLRRWAHVYAPAALGEGEMSPPSTKKAPWEAAR